MDRQQSSIFDELSEDTMVETTPEAAVQSTTETTDERESTPPPVVAKKRGRPPKAKNPAPNATETAVEMQSKPKNSPAITYYLTMFSDAQMRKPEKQRKSVNTFMVLSSEIEFDTLKAQILEKISKSLKPNIIAFENYAIAWTIPRTQASSIPLSSAADYLFLLELACKQKTPSVNLVIETHWAKNKTKKSKKANEDMENDDEGESQDGGSENSESENDHPKKKAKSGKKTKSVIETPLNLKINAKIRLLQNRWMCAKAGCSSEHCFVHPEHSEHFSLGHEHFSVWAAAWNKDETLADLETPPNHHKFNMAPGRKTAEISPLLQRRLADRNQPTNNASPVFNFNVPPELLAVFRPTPTPATIEHGGPPPVHDHQSLVQSGMQHGPNLTLDAFCTLYGLSEEIKTKLRENGYTGSDTLTFIIVPELKEMGFKYGEIAALKAAMRQWCQ